MKKYYLSAIFKDVTGQYGIAGAYDHALVRFMHPASPTYAPGISFAGGDIATDPQTGIPTQKALLVLVDAKDHTVFKVDTDMVPFPDVSLDVKVTAIHTTTKLTFAQSAKLLGLDADMVDSSLDNADGLRDTVNHFGRLNNPLFDANNFDVDVG